MPIIVEDNLECSTLSLGLGYDIKEGFYDAKSYQILCAVSFDISTYYQGSEKTSWIL
ncbi:hypothetical protein [Commensalibacter communis]|uniref:hypothetical protein n=1 Tax=Commensalibacter communis TaxID=2972786 RepID=UPI00232F1199|nr:hypothetical protein [Commensalibacter communis]